MWGRMLEFFFEIKNKCIKSVFCVLVRKGNGYGEGCYISE